MNPPGKQTFPEVTAFTVPQREALLRDHVEGLLKVHAGVGCGFQNQRVRPGRHAQAVVQPGVVRVQDLHPIQNLHES